MERPKDMPMTKKLYYILLNGEYVGETKAVSPQKAVANFWWKYVKNESELSPRDYDPDDFDAVEAGGD